MSCVWTTLIEVLKDPRFNSPRELLKYVKENNIDTIHVEWNNQQFTANQLRENKEWITNINISVLDQGYLCSACDPLLVLVSELFSTDITHNYNGTSCVYTNTNNPDKKIVTIGSNTSHCWAIGTSQASSASAGAALKIHKI